MISLSGHELPLPQRTGAKPKAYGFFVALRSTIGIIRGNPGVKIFNPYPYPQKPLPCSRVWVFKGQGKGFQGYRGYKGLVKGK
jgi:hypothetical protein